MSLYEPQTAVEFHGRLLLLSLLGTFLVFVVGSIFTNAGIPTRRRRLQSHSRPVLQRGGQPMAKSLSQKSVQEIVEKKYLLHNLERG